MGDLILINTHFRMKIVGKSETPNKDKDIYLGIDHLNPGVYNLKITLNNKVIKTVTLRRNN
ncbi:hypothetical protein [Aegicerativicinus sediminis]